MANSGVVAGVEATESRVEPKGRVSIYNFLRVGTVVEDNSRIIVTWICAGNSLPGFFFEAKESPKKA